MAQVDVSRDADTYVVRVVEGGSETNHRVTVSEEDLARLGAGYDSAEELIRASFHFLLDREPKESILSSFDLSVISRYFPEYEDEIRR